MAPNRPDPVSFLTGQLSSRPHPSGVGIPGGGEKFFTDGAVQIWPGNTFICHIDPRSPAFEAIRTVQEKIKCSPYSPFFSFLPPASFHMTVFQGISPEAKAKGVWPGDVSEDQNRDAVSAYFLSRTSALGLPSRYLVRCTDLFACHSLTMTGADNAAETALRDTRRKLRVATGLEFPDFDDYVFHISLAYLLSWVSEPLAYEMAAFSAEISSEYCDAIGDVALGPLEFCNFDSMHHFSPLRYLD